jgi:hypothetical protein
MEDNSNQATLFPKAEGISTPRRIKIFFCLVLATGSGKNLKRSATQMFDLVGNVTNHPGG